ncbi:uncharacterized protein ATNIH1004_011451 [Aspergillus tanneri]|nr:uncharacterized protein ATNIH1004_011451 [Aspergillus tanneri]KAA8642506.1 hypothetical protein ATNIH1004_011451 [Aspergillus tanneri]
MSAGSGDPEQDNSPFQSVYYLGTPSRVKEKDLAGCAVVFHDPPAKKFPAPKLPGNTNLTDTRVAHGTCPAVIEQKCIDNLTKRATMAIDNAQGQDICADLRSQLKRDTIDGCADLAGTGHGLGNFTVTSLGDLSPVRNSSDCWPIQPKSDNLAEITQNTVLRNASAEAVYDEAYKITAVLTVFAGKGNSSLVKQTSSQMTCLKLVTNENPGGDKGADKNSATPIYNGLLTTVVATVFAAMLTSM